MEDFVAEFGLDGFPHAVDADGSLWARLGVSYQPAWVFVNDDGSTKVHPGALDPAGLDAELELLRSG